jgi:hypothetical protein
LASSLFFHIRGGNMTSRFQQQDWYYQLSLSLNVDLIINNTLRDRSRDT